MKRLLLAAMAMLAVIQVSAQNGREIYNRYSGKEGVSAVYISPAMFSLIKEIPDIEIESGDINLGGIIRNFSGMYVLDVENPQLASSLREDVSGMVDKGKYELLMEAVDDSDRIHIYIVRDGETVTDFLLLADEGADSVSVISISGNMPMEELRKILADAVE